MTERERLRAAFLAKAGWGDASCRPLAADASFRTYDRLTKDTGSAVLMNAPPPMENVAVFRRVQTLLLDLGLAAPRALAQDLEAGFLLLEDFGDMTFTRALAGGADERGLYELATDLLIALHQRAPTAAGGLPSYDDARLEEEVLLLTDWTAEAITGQPIPSADRRRYLDAWRELWPEARRVPATLVLRDYHVDNLMVLAGRQGIDSCGLLDFQDALCGPVTYDLVSLLQDARRDIAPALEQNMMERYLAACPARDRAAFDLSYTVLGVQRAAKIIGIFTRLSRRDGKHGYLRHIPRVWRLLERNLRHPRLAALEAWFDRVLPPDLRRQPGEPRPDAPGPEEKTR
jgi:aminoglycoside/choline kinase family phosphotransferase